MAVCWQSLHRDRESEKEVKMVVHIMLTVPEKANVLDTLQISVLTANRYPLTEETPAHQTLTRLWKIQTPVVLGESVPVLHEAAE